MKNRYTKIMLLAFAFFTFFGGTSNVKADMCDVKKGITVSKNKCTWYSYADTKMTAIVSSNEDRICLWNTFSDKHTDFDYDGDGKKDDIDDKIASNGCPVVIEKETNWINHAHFYWYKSTGDYPSFGANDNKDSDGWFQYFSVEDDYYNAEKKASQTGKPGVNIQINALNEKIEPKLKELYQIMNGVDDAGNNTYFVTIGGTKVDIHPYDVSSAFGYADVISKEWKLNGPKQGDFYDKIKLYDYEEYWDTVNNDQKQINETLRGMSSSNLTSLSAWANDAVEAYKILNTMYDEIEKIAQSIPPMLSELTEWGSDISHPAILGATETTYSIMASNLVAGANSGGEWFSSITRRVSSKHTTAYNNITSSIKNYAKYVQFNLPFEENGEDTTLLSKWTTYVGSQLENSNYYLSQIATLCKNGYVAAKDKNNDTAATNFSKCSSNAESMNEALKSLTTSYRETAKSLKLNSFNWRDDVVANCENMMNADLINALSTLYFFIEVAVIVIAVILSIVEFFKATVNSDADSLKKAWANVIKRIIVVIVVFLLPLLIEFVVKTTGVISQDVDDPICIELYGGDN